MRALALALIATAGSAHADDSVRLQTVTIETLDAGTNAQVTKESISAAMRDVRGCVRTDLDIAVSIDLAKGRVAKVIAHSDDAKLNKCVQRTLSSMRLAAAKTKVHVEARITLRSIPLDNIGMKIGGPPGPNDHQASDLHSVIKTRSAAYRDCYKTALAKQPKLGGKFVYRIDVGEDGKVTRARATSPTKLSTQLDRCIVNNLQQLVFAAKGKATISYPMVFTTP